MRIHGLISEIKEMGTNTPRKAAFDIYTMLDNNKVLFQKHLDADVYRQILADFEKMAYANVAEFSSSSYKEDFTRAFNLLTFYLDRII